MKTFKQLHNSQPIYRVFTAYFTILCVIPIFTGLFGVWIHFRSDTSVFVLFSIGSSILFIYGAFFISKKLSAGLNVLSNESEMLLRTKNNVEIYKDRDIADSKIAPKEIIVLSKTIREVLTQLKDSQDYMLSVIANSPIMFIISDLNGKILNSKNEGQQLQAMWKGNLNVDSILNKVSRGEVIIDNIQQAGRDYDLWFGPHYGSNGILDSVIVIATDVSDTKRAKEYSQLLDDYRKLYKKFLTLQEDERKRLATNLHDDIGQLIVGIQTEASTIQDCESKHMRTIHDSAAHIEKIAGEIIKTVKSSIYHLRPPILDDMGLIEGLNVLLNKWGKLNPNIKWSIHNVGQFDDLDDLITISLYRVTQECLTNISKHSDATEINVLLSRGEMAINKHEVYTEECVQLIVNDNGIGLTDKCTDQQQLGLLGMRQRIEGLGGYFEIKSELNEGFIVFARLPIELTEGNR